MASMAVDESVIKQLEQAINRKNPEILPLALQDYSDYINATHATDINFARAGKIVENSAKIYVVEVDNLSALTCNLQLLVLGGKYNDHDDNNGGADEERGDEPAAARVGRQRRRRVKDVGTEDEFFIIDNGHSLPGKCTEEAESASSSVAYIKPSEPYFNPFVKCGYEREKVDVRLKKKEEQKESCLRDYQLTLDLMLVPELFSNLQLPEESDEEYNAASLRLDVSDSEDFMDVGPLTPHSEGVESDVSEASVRVANVPCMPELPSCLVDVSPVEEEINGSGILGVDRWLEQVKSLGKPLKPGKTTKAPPCAACPVRKRHKENGKNCAKRLSVIERYFHPHVQREVKEPAWGVVPLEELQKEFRNADRELTHLIRLREKASGPGDDAEGDEDFGGFDDEDRQEMAIDDEGRISGDLPIPSPCALDSLIPDGSASSESPGRARLNPDDVLSQGSNGLNDINLQEIEEIQRHAVDSAVSRKRVAEWHSSLRGALALAEERGPLHVDATADKIMSMFDGATDDTRTFEEITQGADRSTASRLFFVCLQLTNEGNVDLIPGEDKANATFKRLRTHRLKKVDDYNPEVDGSHSSTSKRSRDDEPDTGNKPETQKRTKKNAKDSDHNAKRQRRYP